MTYRLLMTEQTHSHGLQRNNTKFFLILISPVKFFLLLSLLEFVTEDPDTFAIEQNISGDPLKNECS